MLLYIIKSKPAKGKWYSYEESSFNSNTNAWLKETREACVFFHEGGEGWF